MAKGAKTGGRKAGTPNKKTEELKQIISNYGHNPIESLVMAAMDDELDKAQRIRINLELMQYLYPKRKAVELSGESGNPISFKIENA